MLDAVVINSAMSVLFLVALAFWADRYERESGRLLVAIFFASVLATGAFALVKCLALGLCEDGAVAPMVDAYVVTGAAEEALKFAILAAILPRLRSLDEPMDAIIYLGVVALGFSFHENVQYFLQFTAEGGRIAQETGDATVYREQLRFIFLVRAIPAHLLFDTCAAALLGYALQRGRLAWWLVPTYLLASLLHGTWNVLAGTFVFPLYVLSLLAGSVAVLLWAVRRSPYRRRQFELQRELKHTGLADTTLPRRLLRAMRRTSGARQTELAYLVRAALVDTPATAEARIADLIDEENQLNGPGLQFGQFVAGILLAGFSAELVLALVVMALAGTSVT
ncbi:MAG TPA: PrsW family glutamic-type intramembrane protease [Candidatus Krumholzibacteria bacterium]|nr:PrsW family glutamic-type intramembrane protease [Candidatus Krumholzibacteria bacterium]HPD70612.1 PrsW family glutamic-type intramembrane protease [Candidatus Krumholzibacteria bacterium]HRY39688.1 PrsW family glutamic-type intramembrane protease [Candidatus Krumholzibacteria bacterium]